MSVTDASRTTTRYALVAACVVAATALLWARPAWAHTRLESSEPAGDSTVTDPFDTVVLIFNQAVADDFAEVRVTDAEGNRLDEETPVMDGERVEQPLTELQEVGDYTVEWRVVANDGHPLEGDFAFTYDGELPEDTADEEPAAPEPDATPESRDTDDSHDADGITSSDEDAAHDTDGTADEDEEGAAAPAPDDRSRSGGASWPIGVATFVVAIAAGAAVYAVRVVRSWAPVSGPQAG